MFYRKLSLFCSDWLYPKNLMRFSKNRDMEIRESRLQRAPFARCLERWYTLLENILPIAILQGICQDTYLLQTADGTEKVNNFIVEKSATICVSLSKQYLEENYESFV